MLHYFLRQEIPPDSGDPIEIHITEDDVLVGRKEIHALSQFNLISRKHAVFHKSDNDTLFVKDLNSLNGVFVNGIRIGSSLKLLSIGDRIGFGVTTASASEGFVCVLCADSGPKPELIEISDREPEQIGGPHIMSNSGNSGLQTSHTSKSEALHCKPNIESTYCNKNKNPTKVCKFRNAPEISKDVKYFKCKSQRKSSEFMIHKKCVVSLVRCDSKDSQLPSEVKNPFQSDGKHKNKPWNHRRKRLRVLSSDSEDSEGGVHSVTSLTKNPRLDLEFSSNETSNYVTTPSKDSSPGDVSNSHLEHIHISEDEYLDCNSLQIHENEIKPKEVDENDIFKEIFGSESDDEHFEEQELVHQESSDIVESVKSISAFINDSEKENPKVLRPDLSTGNNYVQINNCIFPVPSRHTESDLCKVTDTTSDDDEMSCPVKQSTIHYSTEYQTTDADSPQNKNSKRSIGKTLLIDPIPMTYRSRRLRGRDEDFVEKSKPLDQLISVARKQKEKRKKKSSNLPETASTSSIKNSTPKTSSVKTRPEQISNKSGESSRGYYTKEIQQIQTVSNNDTGIRSHTYPHVAEKPTLPIARNLSCSNDVIKKLLQMNTNWLQEQTAKKYPPPFVSDGAADLPLSYRFYESYVSSFYPMIMLEIWEHMFIESQKVYASNRYKKYKKFYFSILSITSREDCIELKCESVVKKECFGPREGVIALLEVGENSTKCSPLFGYIFKHKVEQLNLSTLNTSQWKTFSEEYLQNAMHWTFHAYIKKKTMPFDLTSLMIGNGLCDISSKLRLADSLNSIKNSPLLKDILTPREETVSTNHLLLSSSRKSFSQTEVINHISDEISKPYMQPKIVLLHDSPATEKSHAIIGLLEKLFYNGKNKSNPKILITASSNEAIDEIGCRLIALNERSDWRGKKIKFVRVGSERQIHPKIMPFSVDKKAKELYQKMSYYQTTLKETELQNLPSEINERSKYLRNECKHVTEQSSIKTMDYYTELKYKTIILKESDIILSTLSSCSLPLLHRSFNSNSKYFSCCIIEDATHCTELEALQPLALGVRKLILIGNDHISSSGCVTVLSKMAAQFGFQRSLFERFHLYFQRHDQDHNGAVSPTCRYL